MTSIDIVLFDLGGVLVDLGGVASMKDLAGIDDEEEIWQRWLTCRWVRGFERGECTPGGVCGRHRRRPIGSLTAPGVASPWGPPRAPADRRSLGYRFLSFELES